MAETNSSRTTSLDLESEDFAQTVSELQQQFSTVDGESAERASATNDAEAAARPLAASVRGPGGLPILRGTSLSAQQRARPLPQSLRCWRAAGR